MADLIDRNPDVAGDAEQRALSQFDESTVVQGIIAVISASVQLLEDKVAELANDTQPSNAEGVHLDQWGELVGEPRNGLSDDDYRLLIQNRIGANASSGTAEEMIALVTGLVAPASNVHIVEEYPAGFSISYSRATPTSAELRARVRAKLINSKAGGVRLEWVVEADEAGYFGFAGDPDALGFDVGIFAEVI